LTDRVIETKDLDIINIVKIGFADQSLSLKDEKKVKELSKAFKYNYCSFINNELFWECLAPMSEGGGVVPDSYSELGKAIDKSFGSFDSFVS